MNANPDGSALSDEQLIGFALRTGQDEAHLRNRCADAHNPNVARGILDQASAAQRFAAWESGELTWNPKVPLLPDFVPVTAEEQQARWERQRASVTTLVAELGALHGVHV